MNSKNYNLEDLKPSDITISNEESEELEISIKRTDQDGTNDKYRDSGTNGSSKEELIILISDRPENEDSSNEETVGSEKESYLPSDSKGSSKELFIPETSSKGSLKETPAFFSESKDSGKEIIESLSEDADIPSLDRITGSEKELEGDNTISEIRIRFDPQNPERGFIDKRSFWTESGNFVEIMSSEESEMNTYSKRSNSRQPIVNFYNVNNSQENSDKEEEMEVSNGSSKELIGIEEKPYDPFKDGTPENSSMKNEDLESKESSKQINRSEGENKLLNGFTSPLGEESEEDEKSYYSKTENLSSH